MGKKCIIFTGLQASGKTTFRQRRFPDLAHVNLDTLHTRNRERLLMEECFASGASFVVDNTNPSRKDRERYITAAKEHGYRVTGYYFQSSIHACMERNRRREGKARVPDVALASTYSKLEVPAWEEGFDELYYVRIDRETFVTEPWNEEN
jgi:predicted kinase